MLIGAALKMPKESARISVHMQAMMMDIRIFFIFIRGPKPRIVMLKPFPDRPDLVL